MTRDEETRPVDIERAPAWSSVASPDDEEFPIDAEGDAAPTDQEWDAGWPEAEETDAGEMNAAAARDAWAAHRGAGVRPAWRSAAAAPAYQPAYRRTQTRERPAGVAVLAVLNFIAAGLAALGALLVVVDGGGENTIVTLVVVILAAGLWVIMGSGLWQVRRWAHRTALILYALNCVFALLGLCAGFNLTSLLQLGVAALVVAYLSQERVRAAFT